MEFWRAVSYVFTPAKASMFTVVVLTLFAAGNASLVNLVLGSIFLVVLPHGLRPIRIKKEEIDEETQRLKRFPTYERKISFFLLGSAVFYVLDLNALFVFAVCLSITESLLWALNHYTKVSIHTAGVTRCTTVLIYFLGYWMAIGYAVAGLVAISRLKLKAHTLGQAVLGLLVGFFGAFITLEIML
ncbi:hypothetical protein COX85_04040 [Candidatus Micrarchaeota archaeon CG_4_10_14_0_2_um_filter_55_9]|nr:MAG: hypothetical protein AUJ15_00165 [Candidatus Micrarchaeota archaeon CG1_02_55_41]PIZ91410.1 MAG: hypothetical protein COX85_04040 [Candidatus Micrarchaeota archaeon CG_4_10_14_0_2_um_filter_55_9]PJD01176.1 MAG: hypothetical protein COU38_02385 [Candidatus Micrarchaeota archaeon CG10_big_fil_rev_8_21_14_0_10_54_18]